MSDKNPTIGPEGLAQTVPAISQQISAVERAGDLKVEALRRELEAGFIAARHEREAIVLRLEKEITSQWANHDALHGIAHEAAAASLTAYQRESDALTEVRRREADEKLECIKRDFAIDIKRIDALIAAEVASLVQIIDERDRLYSTQFKASEVAVNAALAAQEKAVNAAFLASEKAIVKAEVAQKDYNDRSNDYRSQIDMQAKSMMPRIEVVGMFKGVDDRFTFMQQAYDASLSAVRISHEKIFDAIIKDVAGLRESRSEGAGKGAGAQQSWGVLIGAVGLIAALLAIAFRFV